MTKVAEKGLDRKVMASIWSLFLGFRDWMAVVAEDGCVYND